MRIDVPGLPFSKVRNQWSGLTLARAAAILGCLVRPLRFTEPAGKKQPAAKPPIVPPPPDPPFDIETFEPIEPSRQAIREWIPDDDAEPSFEFFNQRPDSGKPVEIRREDGSILVIDSN